MRLYIDSASGQFIQGVGNTLPVDVSNILFKRGDTTKVEVLFTSVNSIIELTGYTGQIAIKKVGDFDGNALSISSNWVQTGSGASTIYTFDLNLNTTEINTALGHDGAGGNDIAEMVVMLEVQWTNGTVIQSTTSQQATLENDVIKGNEGTPTSALATYPSAASVIAGLADIQNKISKSGDGATIKSELFSQADTNNLTDAMKSVLEGFDATHYLAPVQNTSQLAAKTQASLSDKARLFVEDEGSDYFYDAQATSGNVTPTGQSGGIGFWVKATASGGAMTGAQIAAALYAESDTNRYTDVEKQKLATVALGATSNSSDAQLRDRSTHTGTQLASTISDLSSAITSQITTNASVSTNTAKVSNATHTGEVTGSTALTIHPTAIANKPIKATPVAGDALLIGDSEASGALKRVALGSLVGGGGLDIALGASDTKFTTPPTETHKLLLRWDTKQMYGSNNVTTVGEPTSATQINHSTPIGRGAIFMNNGSLLVSLLNGLEIKIVAHPLSTPYDVSTKGAQVYNQAIDTAFAGSGNTLPSNLPYTLSKLYDDSKLYLISSDRIHQFNMATAGDLTTLTYANKISGVVTNYTIAYSVSPDGSKLLASDNFGSGSGTYTMTNGDLSTATLVSAFPNSKLYTPNNLNYLIYADNTGMNFIGVGSSNSTLYKVTLSVANDFNSTITHGSSLSINNNLNSGGLFWDSQSGHLMAQGDHNATDTNVYRSSTTSIAWQPFSFA